MNIRQWLGMTMGGAMAIAAVAADSPTTEIELPRPGAVIATDVTGEVTLLAGDERKAIKMDDRLRVGSTITTARKSFVSLLLSNGTTLQLGSESELEIEEFGQVPVADGTKFAELTAEPTVSRTRLRLVRGDVSGDVKKLNLMRGSSFLLATNAGTLRVVDGAFRTMTRMTELGIGLATLEIDRGGAEFQPVGSVTFARVSAGQKLAFALEVDKVTGSVKLGEMPKPDVAPKPAAK